MQSVCQNKHVMKQEEAVRADLPLSLQMEYPVFVLLKLNIDILTFVDRDSY